MSTTNTIISIDDVVESLRFDYDKYLVGLISSSRQRREMSTEFDHYPVVTALLNEIQAKGTAEATATEAVVRAITIQGVDKFYASEMAKDGLKQLVASIGLTLTDLTFDQIEQGNMVLCNATDLYVSYTQ